MRTSYSCASCAKRKRKCDLTKPGCNRCKKLKIECVWPSKNRFLSHFQFEFRDYGVQSAGDVFVHNLGQQDAHPSLLPRSLHPQMVENVVYIPEHESRIQPGFDLGLTSTFPLLRKQPVSLHMPTAVRPYNFDRLETEALCSQLVETRVEAIDMYDMTGIKAQSDCNGHSYSWLSDLEGHIGAWPEMMEDVDCKSSEVLPIDSVSPLSQTDYEELIVGSQPGQELYSKDSAYVNLFFTVFCSSRSVLMQRELWSGVVTAAMHKDVGVYSAVLAVASMYAHRAHARSDAGQDSLLHYRGGVTSVQNNLHLDITKYGSPSEATLVGITMLMVYEMMTGNLTAFRAHVAALGSIIQQTGPDKCEHGIHRILLLTILHPILISSLQTDSDTFLADPKWLKIIGKLIDVPQRARKTELYLRAARLTYLRGCWNLLSKTHPIADHQLSLEVTACEESGLAVLRELRQMYAEMVLDEGLRPVTNPLSTSVLSASPWQPSLTMKNELITSAFPFLIAMILYLEITFEIYNPNASQMVSCLMQITQYVVVHCDSSAALLHQVWPLQVAARVVETNQQRAWISICKSYIETKGFAIANGRRGSQ